MVVRAVVMQHKFRSSISAPEIVRHTRIMLKPPWLKLAKISACVDYYRVDSLMSSDLGTLVLSRLADTFVEFVVAGNVLGISTLPVADLEILVFLVLADIAIFSCRPSSKSLFLADRTATQYDRP